MSTYASIYCLDSKTFAPELGDGGSLGLPDLDVSRTLDADRNHRYTFGWIYEGLKVLSIRVFETERFREFLVAHVGKDIGLEFDTADPDIDWEQFTQFTSTLDPTLFIRGHFRITNPVTGQSVTSKFTDLFLPPEPASLDRAAVASALSFLDCPDLNVACHRTFGVLDRDGDMGRIIEFLKQNADCDELAASIIPFQRKVGSQPTQSTRSLVSLKKVKPWWQIW